MPENSEAQPRPADQPQARPDTVIVPKSPATSETLTGNAVASGTARSEGAGAVAKTLVPEQINVRKSSNLLTEYFKQEEEQWLKKALAESTPKEQQEILMIHNKDWRGWLLFSLMNCLTTYPQNVNWGHCPQTDKLILSIP